MKKRLNQSKDADQLTIEFFADNSFFANSESCRIAVAVDSDVRRRLRRQIDKLDFVACEQNGLRVEIRVQLESFRGGFSFADLNFYFGVSRPDAVGVGRAARIFDERDEFNR